jgi:hypothetical protein
MTDVTPPSGRPGPSGEPAGPGDELTPEELASGYLDDELEAEERARVQRDPALMELVADLRAVSKAVAAPITPLNDEQRSAMVGAAMATLPTSAAAAATSETVTASVASLDAARARRSARLVRTVAGGLAAAAAVGLLALVVTRGGTGNQNDTADGVAAATAALEAAAGSEVADPTTADVAAADAAAADTTAVAVAPASEAPATEAPAEATGGATSSAPAAAGGAGAERAVPDLGPLANRREARSATTSFASVVPPPDGTGPCAGYPPPVATATFQGTPAYVVVIEVAPEGNRLAFLDQVTCAVLVKVDPVNA